MRPTYRVMQVAKPGVLEWAERPTPVPEADEVLVAVEACGICGADVSDIERPDPAGPLPRVPGHEVVGRIVAAGVDALTSWRLGQRVGIGRLGGHCNACRQCRQGNFQLCLDQSVVGRSVDGGYAEMMLARSTGLVAIPEALSSEDAAPILCAGLATFNALKKCGAEPGDVVAILGIGGLGHLAVQYARKMGFNVVAVGRGQDIADDILDLGAHTYIDTHRQGVGDTLAQLGGAAAILATVSQPDLVGDALAGLAPRGRLVMLGAGKDHLALPAALLVGGERQVVGSMTGTPFQNERALQFSVLVDVRPQIEVMPLERANEAYQRMKAGKVKFRMVLRPSPAS